MRPVAGRASYIDQYEDPEGIFRSTSSFTIEKLNKTKVLRKQQVLQNHIDRSVFSPPWSALKQP